MATPPPVELPRAQERLAIAALALAAFALNLNTNVLGALLPFVGGDLGLQPGDDGLLIVAAAVGSALGALVGGPLADRYGRRRALLWGLLGFAIASALHLPARTFAPFLVVRALAGAAVGVAYAAASASVAEIVPYERRGAAMGRFTAGMFLAYPIGLPLSVAMARAGWWRGVFVLQTALALLGVWWAARAVPNSPPRTGAPLSLRPLVRGPVAAGLLATMLHVGSFFTTIQLAGAWLDTTGQVPKEQQIWLWVGLGLASVFGSAWLGRSADRFGKRTFVLATSVVLVGCFVALSREPGAWALLAVGLVLAVTAAARTGPLQALVSGLVPPEHLAAVMGLRGFVMQIGVALFASVAGLVDKRLGFQGVLMLGAGCQMLSYVAIRFGVPRGR